MFISGLVGSPNRATDTNATSFSTKLIVDGGVHQKSGSRHTRLSRRREHAGHHSLDRRIQVRVWEHDIEEIPSSSSETSLQFFGGGGCD